MPDRLGAGRVFSSHRLYRQRKKQKPSRLKCKGDAMIFGVVPGPLVILVVIIAGFSLVEVVRRAKRAADGNLRQQLKPRQRAIYGLAWLGAALLLAACAVGIYASRSLTPLTAVFGLAAAVAICLCGIQLCIVWPLPRHD